MKSYMITCNPGLNLTPSDVYHNSLELAESRAKELADRYVGSTFLVYELVCQYTNSGAARKDKSV